MIPNVYTLLILIAFALAILAGVWRPGVLWVAVLLITVALLVQVIGH